MKKILSLFLTILFGVSLFGACATKQDADTLIIWWGPGEERKISLIESLERFRAENANFKYELKIQASDEFSDYFQKVLMGDEKNAPDIIVTDHSVIQSLGVKGRLLDLAAYGANEYRNMFFETNWKANCYGDRVYGMPLDANCVALMYNKDILILAGVVDENGEAAPPKTYEEFLAACEKIKKKGITPFAFPIVDHSNFSPYMFTSWIARNGGSIISEDGAAATVNDEKGVDTLRKIMHLVEKGYIETAWQPYKFHQGKVAMIEMGSWDVKNITGDNIGISELFTIDPTVPNYSILGLYSLGMSSKCVNKQMAADLIAHLTTDAAFVKAYTGVLDLFPSLKSLIDDDQYKKGYFPVYNSQIQKTVNRPGSPAWAKTQTYIMNTLETSALVSGSVPSKLLDDLAKNIDKEIKAFRG